MQYRLKSEKGGVIPERTYEFNNVSSAKAARGNPGTKSSRQSGQSVRNTATEEARRRIERGETSIPGKKSASDAHQQHKASNTAPRADISYRLSSHETVRNEHGGYDPQRTYEFTTTIRRPQQSSTPKAIRHAPKTKAARYVLNKNGRRVAVHSEAESQQIMRERELAIQNEHKRILEEIAAAKAEQSILTVKATRRTHLPAKFIAAIVICTAVFMVIVYDSVLLNERNHEINDLENELDSIVGQRAELEEALEKKNDLIYIENYAVNRLGMVKSDRLSRQYISIATADRIELIGTNGESKTAETSPDEVTPEEVAEEMRSKVNDVINNLN